MIACNIYYDYNKKTSLIKTIDDVSFFWRGKKYIIPKGFVSNGASVPAVFWGVITPCIDGRTIMSAVIHDYLYATGIVARHEADDIFLHYLLKNKFPKIKSYICYFAVRIFGKKYYKKNEKN